MLCRDEAGVTVTAKNVICHTSQMAVSSYHHDPQKAAEGKGIPRTGQSILCRNFLLNECNCEWLHEVHLIFPDVSGLGKPYDRTVRQSVQILLKNTLIRMLNLHFFHIIRYNMVIRIRRFG